MLYLPSLFPPFAVARLALTLGASYSRSCLGSRVNSTGWFCLTFSSESGAFLFTIYELDFAHIISCEPGFEKFQNFTIFGIVKAEQWSIIYGKTILPQNQPSSCNRKIWSVIFVTWCGFFGFIAARGDGVAFAGKFRFGGWSCGRLRRELWLRPIKFNCCLLSFSTS